MWKLTEGLQHFQTHSCLTGMKEIPRKEVVSKTWGGRHQEQARFSFSFRKGKSICNVCTCCQYQDVSHLSTTSHVSAEWRECYIKIQRHYPSSWELHSTNCQHTGTVPLPPPSQPLCRLHRSQKDSPCKGGRCGPPGTKIRWLVRMFLNYEAN